MNAGKYNLRHSLALLVAIALLTFCSITHAEHGGRDRTEREEHHTESHSDGDRGSSREGNDSREGSGRDEKHGDKDDDSKRESGDGKDVKLRDMDSVVASATESRISSDIDFEGHARRSSEVLLVGRDEHLAALRDAGYRVITTQRLSSLGESIVRVRVNTGESIEQALQHLRTIVPDADIASNHLFRASQQPSSMADGTRRSIEANAITSNTSNTVIGIIDTGADNSQDVLKVAVIDTQGLTDSGYVARTHGTIVSKIACTEGARLAVADVFGVDNESHLVAPADAIARAVDWLLAKHVLLINVSIEGPDNAVLAHVIRRAIAQGAVIVAAAGNSGPAAPAAFPAAYPGVIAVTAVDENNNVYPRANRGQYIAFAARGVRVPVSDGAARGMVSGTSFAAPIVTAEIARRFATSPGNVNSVLESMKHDAVDLGTTGRDNVYGWGLIRPPASTTQH